MTESHASTTPDRAIDVDASVPAMPVPAGEEMGSWVHLLIHDRHPSVGWQFRQESRGGPCFLVARDTLTGGMKIYERFPLTQDGWQLAWRLLVNTDNTLERPLRQMLAGRAAADAARAAVTRLDEEAQVRVKSVALLGGYLVGQDLVAGTMHDLRFLDQRLLVTAADGWQPLIDVPFSDIEEIEVGGPGIVSRLTRAQQAGMTIAFGLLGAALAYGDTKIQTIIRVRVPAGELYYLCSSKLPDVLKIELARPLGAIRAARASTVGDAEGQPATAEARIEKLLQLNGLLEAGLLTRREFDDLKGELLAGR